MDPSPSSEILFLIRSSPSTTRRSVEGLRIAMSFAASWDSIKIVLVNEAVVLLSKDFVDAEDEDIDVLEKLLPAFQDMKTLFYVENEALNNVDLDPLFSVLPVPLIQISDMLANSSYSMIF